MDTPASQLEALFEKAQAFGLTTYELSKLKALETTTNVVTSLVSRLAVIAMVAIFVFIFSTGVAFWLGGLLGEVYYGFFVVAAFYMSASLLLHFFLHKWIRKPLSDSIISQALQ
ncbi:MAG: hypothetical protein AB9834_14055 [Lentimicrobium sp.]